jgi:histidinol-phosphatase
MAPADPWLPFLHEIADEADRIALSHFRSADLRVSTKSNSSPVTAADLSIEESARALLRRKHPELGVLGEEHGEAEGSSGLRLIIDPIDSTKNFIRGIPVFATLLAIEESGEITAGVVSSPALRTRWHAARGQGAFRDDRRLRVSAVPTLEASQLFHGGLKDDTGAILSKRWADVFRRAGRTRGFGDFYQHVLVAEGAGEMAFDPSLAPWDMAPLVVLVEEAGGRVSSVEGDRSIYGGTLISSNGLVHEEVLRLLGSS